MVKGKAAVKLLIVYIVICLLMTACRNSKQNDINQALKTGDLTQKEELGKLLFFEESLSSPEGQSCATCHDPGVGFADPVTELPVSRGAVAGLYGNRNDMPVSYAMYIPPLHFDEEEGLWVGGLFWDGRVNTLEEQAKLPPLNPIEMAAPDVESLLEKLKALPYVNDMLAVYGNDALTDPETAFDHMVDAIAAYERTNEVNPFTSKFDFWQKGLVEMTEQELLGLKIFELENKGNCAACHPTTPTVEGVPPLFTDFTYDNLGTPANGEMPFYTIAAVHNPDGFGFVDLGLEITVNDPAQRGKFRVPTLRNIAVTPPYMHNGVFKTLFQVCAFYNTRDVANWPAPEVAENVNHDELGDLKLTNEELEALVAFMKTLTDGYQRN